jgi:hypothetical protein
MESNRCSGRDLSLWLEELLTSVHYVQVLLSLSFLTGHLDQLTCVITCWQDDSVISQPRRHCDVIFNKCRYDAVENGRVTQKNVRSVHLDFVNLAYNCKQKRDFKRRGNGIRRIVVRLKFLRFGFKLKPTFRRTLQQSQNT